MGSPLDDIKKLLVKPGTKAQGRFTRTPIKIMPSDKSFDEPTGYMDPEANQIGIRTLPETNLGDLGRISAHEQIHALLNSAGLLGKPLPSAPATSDPLALFNNPQQAALNSWDASNRAGNFKDELPAYIGTNDKKLKDLSPEDRKRWLETYRITLPPAIRTVFDRIVKSQE